MEYNNLRYFKAAAETENFTRAAELMGVSQAYLSRIVRRLEDDLGVPLFVRAGRRVELNQYGKHLYEATNNCFRTIHNARNEISNVLSTDKQRVRLVWLAVRWEISQRSSKAFMTKIQILPFRLLRLVMTQ